MKFSRKKICSARPQPDRVRGRGAFTLIEIMVAIAIFMLVIAAIYSTWELVMRATKVGQDAAAQAQRRRIALRTIEDSLMCIQSFQASHQYYSFIVENGDTPLLSFASRLPEIFPRNGKFGDFNLRRLTFTLETGTDGEKNLVLRQNPILMEMDLDEKKDPLILARNVQKFTIECWDTNQLEWMDEWNNTNSIPPMVRVSLVLGGNVEAGGTAPKMSVTRAFSMPSAMMPAMVQTGGAGGFPGAPGIQLTPPGKNNSAPGGQPPGNYPGAGGPGIIPPTSFGR
jgi:prepilin-type N-terminal cleavage/methylation domain-containing protein